MCSSLNHKALEILVRHSLFYQVHCSLKYIYQKRNNRRTFLVTNFQLFRLFSGYVPFSSLMTVRKCLYSHPKGSLVAIMYFIYRSCPLIFYIQNVKLHWKYKQCIQCLNISYFQSLLYPSSCKYFTPTFACLQL